MGDTALGQVTSQAWDVDPTGPAGHTLLQQEQLSTQGLFVPASMPPDPLDLSGWEHQEREERPS